MRNRLFPFLHLYPFLYIILVIRSCLIAFNLQLEGALRLWQINPNQAQTFLHEAKQTGSMALQEMRQSVSAMRADPLH
jgi:signal transduction histidine kinase